MDAPTDHRGHRSFALPGSRLHYGPDRQVDVEHIDLYLEPDLEKRSLDGICTTTVRALDEDVETVTLDAVDLIVSRVEREGRDQRFERRDDCLTIRFDPVLRAGERTTFSVRYRVVEPRHGLFFVQPTPERPDLVAHAWTQSQDENARYWFPCFDHPYEKQTTSATIVVPKGLFALSNGALVERRDEGDRTIFRYRQDVPHSTYLVTMVVGPFTEIAQGTAGRRSTPVFYYVHPGREADGERAFANTPRMLALFEERTGMPYPFARYSQIAVSDFIFGGMENTAATTQTDRTLHDETAHLDFSSDPLVSHELAHQWFGDLVTCRDWAHAWLNEGFATFFECVWREADLGYDEYLYDIFCCIADYLEEDSEKYRRPIVCNRYRDPIELFDRHLYQKGAAVLHMLRGELGDRRFWRSIRRYVEQNAGRNVETIDLIRAIEEATGRNMRGFFDRWVFGAGHPVLSVRARWDEWRGAVAVTVEQSDLGEGEAPFEFDVELGLCSESPAAIVRDHGPGVLSGERRVRVRVERERETFVIPLDRAPAMVRFDPGAFVLGDVRYELGSAFAVATLGSDPDPVARIRAARELAKEGAHDARAALAGVFRHEPFWGVAAEVAKALGETRAPWAKAILRDALVHEHPKVRRAVAEALGAFRDAETADALLRAARGDRSYFVRAAAAEALGKTRDPRAFDVLRAIAAERTWNGTVESGAVRGAAETGDPRALDLAREAIRPGNDEALRRAGAAALGRIGERLERERTAVVEALDRLLDDAQFHVRRAAITAAGALGDARLIPTLRRISETAFDGRLRRDAAEAVRRIEEARAVPPQVQSLRDAVDELRAEQRKLAEKIAPAPA